MKKLKFRQLFGQAWKLYLKNFWVFLAGAVILGVVGIVDILLQRYATGFGILVSLLFGVFRLWICVGFALMALGTIDTGRARFRMLFSGLPQIAEVFFGSVVFFLLLVLGTVLLVIPGIYVALRLGQFVYFILDGKLSWKEAMKASNEATRGHEWKLLAIIGTLVILSFIGLLFWGIPSVVTTPMVSLVSALIYQELTGKTPRKRKKRKPPQKTVVATEEG